MFDRPPKGSAVPVAGTVVSLWTAENRSGQPIRHMSVVGNGWTLVGVVPLRYRHEVSEGDVVSFVADVSYAPNLDHYGYFRRLSHLEILGKD